MDQSTTLRACRTCEAEQPLNEYYADARSPGGYRTACKTCIRSDQRRRAMEQLPARRAYQASYRAAHRQEARERTARWREENPVRAKAAVKAYREEPEHRQTARVRAAAFRLANPDKRSDYARRRNALKRESAIGPITSAMLAAKREFWGDRCWMCGGVGSGWDHVKPLVKGGPHVLANLRPACIPCNMAKHDRWPYPTTPFADARR